MGFFRLLNETLIYRHVHLVGSRDNMSLVHVWLEPWQALLIPVVIVLFHGSLLFTMRKPSLFFIFITGLLTLYLQVSKYMIVVSLSKYLDMFIDSKLIDWLSSKIVLSSCHFTGIHIVLFPSYGKFLLNTT